MAVNCGDWSIRNYRPDGSRFTVRLYCNSWTCPTCAPRLKAKYRRRFNLSLPTDRYSLLFYPGTKEQLSLAVNRFSLRLRRSFSRFDRMMYVKPEVNGFLIAMVSRDKIPGKLIRRLWEMEGGRLLLSHEGKAATNDFLAALGQVSGNDFPKRFRVIRMSRGFLERLPLREPNGFWRILPHTIDYTLGLSSTKCSKVTGRWSGAYAQAPPDCQECPRTPCLERGAIWAASNLLAGRH